MLTKLESTTVPTPENPTNTVISYIDKGGQYRQRSFDLFNEIHREKIIKTLQYAKAHRFELRIRFK